MEADRSATNDLLAGIKFLNSIAETALVTGGSRSKVYEWLAAGELKAVKDGSRTLVTGESIVERTRKLPPATIGKSKAAA